MSKKGGYLILDFKGLNIKTTETEGQISDMLINGDIYSLIEQNYNKRMVVSGLQVDNIEINDFEVYQPKHISNLSLFDNQIESVYVITGSNFILYVTDKIYSIEDTIKFNCLGKTWPMYKEYKVSTTDKNLDLKPFDTNDLISINFTSSLLVDGEKVKFNVTFMLTTESIIEQFYVALPNIFGDATIKYAIIKVNTEINSMGVTFYDESGSSVAKEIEVSYTCINNKSLTI